jgi:hypothetical protein
VIVSRASAPPGASRVLTRSPASVRSSRRQGSRERQSFRAASSQRVRLSFISLAVSSQAESRSLTNRIYSELVSQQYLEADS